MAKTNTATVEVDDRQQRDIAEAEAALRAAEAAIGDAWRALHAAQADNASDDLDARVRAHDADPDKLAKAVNRAEKVRDVARRDLAEAEEREREQRTPRYELRAIALLRQVDGLLDTLGAVVREQIALDEQARMAGCAMDAGIFAGAVPERIEHWRSQNARRLARGNTE
jgi:hypothetical protein